MIVAGLDCGATSTKGLVLRDNKKIAYCTSGPANPTSTPHQLVEKNIIECLNTLRLKANVPKFDFVALSVASTGEGAWRDFYKRIIVERDFSDRVYVYEDYIAAHYSCFKGSPGVVYIAGTGSSAYIIDENGLEAKIGGWGHLVGDEGSGYYVGSEGIKAALKCLDYRGELTTLSIRLFDYLGIEDLRDIVRKIYTHPSPKELIAGFAKIVVDEARKGDKISLRILEKAAEEIALTFYAAFRLSSLTDFCIMGGFYCNSKDILRRLIIEKVGELVNVEVSIREPLMSLEEAVIYMALEELSENNIT